MNTFPVIWILTAIILFLLSAGLGLFTKRKSQVADYPFGELLVTGFAVLVTLGSLTTLTSFTARFTTPLVVVLVLIGILRNFRVLGNYLRKPIEIGLLILSYFLAGIPVLAIRDVSWPGWVQLDDTATFLAITNHVMSKGQGVPTEIVSTYDRTIQVVLGGSFYGTYDAATNATSFSYPVGSLIPLGVTGQISKIDLAWLYFPYLAFCIALTSVILFGLINKFLINKPIAILASITTASASTLYAYALWGGIKEVALVPLLIYSTVNLSKISRANLIPIVLSGLAIFSVGGTSGLGFILCLLGFVFVFKLIEKNRARFSKRLIPISVLAGIVVILLARPAVSLFNKYLIPEMPDSGNLARPLSLWQLMGIWPSGDFRNDIYWQPWSYIGLFVIALVALFGLWKAIFSENQLYAIGLLATLTIVIYSTLFSGIWLTGKAIAVASPFFLLVTFYGIQKLSEHKKFQVISSILLISVVAGVGTANYLGYRHTWLAPSEKIKELQLIGKEFSGQGPALMTDYAVLASRYFLRELDAESASELRVNLIPMKDGTELKKGFSADIGLFDNKEISKYQLLVLKHTATGSRPLFNYDLAYEGKFYDVWRKSRSSNERISSISLGNNYLPGEVLSCKAVKERVKNSQGKVYAAVRGQNQVISLDGGQLPKGWKSDEGNFGAVVTNGSGYLQAVVEAPVTAEYEWFIGGSYPGKIRIFLDRKEIFTGKGFFEGNKFLGNYLFTSEVSAGKHLIEIRYSNPLLQPGAGVTEALGPLYLASETAADAKIISAGQEDLQKLCNKNLDWLAWVEK